MKSTLLACATALVLSLTLQCSSNNKEAGDLHGNTAGQATGTAESEDSVESKRRYEAMLNGIESASKKLRIDNLRGSHGTEEIRVWIGFGVTQPRLFVMRLSDPREASFHTAKTVPQADVNNMDVPETKILGAPKSGWAEFENFLKAQGIGSPMQLSQESSRYLRSPDVQVIAFEAKLGGNYSMVFFHIDNPSDDARKALTVCHRIAEDFQIEMYCGNPSPN